MWCVCFFVYPDCNTKQDLYKYQLVLQSLDVLQLQVSWAQNLVVLRSWSSHGFSAAIGKGRGTCGRSLIIRWFFFGVQFFQLARSKSKLVIQLFSTDKLVIGKGEAEVGWLYVSGHGER